MSLRTEDLMSLVLKSLLLAGLSIWSGHFIFASIEDSAAGRSFLHLVNLPFHEAGHIFFSPFGRLMQALGGSLMQLVIPLVCMLVLLLKTRDPFGAAVALWWLGENFLDLAPYINDARDLKLVLLGGVTGAEVEGYHDWEFILRQIGCLQCDHGFARIAQCVGGILTIGALVWAGRSLYSQYMTGAD